jgi:hypothetical protein
MLVASFADAADAVVDGRDSASMSEADWDDDDDDDDAMRSEPKMPAASRLCICRTCRMLCEKDGLCGEKMSSSPESERSGMLSATTAAFGEEETAGIVGGGWKLEYRLGRAW